MPEGVVEKQPDRTAVWTFQEVEAVGGSEVISFNSRVNGKVNALQQRGRNCTLRSQTYTFSTTSHFWLYLPNAEISLDLEVKGLTSLASVVAITGPC
jgi:hypothetical protein